MASYARRFILHNVRVVGGCCGTTPEHIRQIKAAVRALAPAVAAAAIDAPGQPRAGRVRRRLSDRARRPSRASRSPGSRARWPVADSSSRSSCCRPAASARAGRSSARATLKRSRRRRRQHPRRFARRRALERPVPRGAHRAAGRHRDAAALLLSRSAICSASSPSCSARTRWGCAICCSSPETPGRAGITRMRRRCSTSIRSVLTNVVSRLNHGCDVGGRRLAPHGLSHRRVGQSGGAESGRRAAAVRVQGRGRRGVRPHRPVFDLRDVRARSSSGSRRPRLPVVAGVVSVRERAKCRVHGQRGAGRPGARGR